MDSEHNNTTVTDDGVNHPNHYTWHPSGVECIDIIQEFDYNIGAAVGYLWRYKYKDGVRDLRKAIQHIQFEIERIESNAEPEPYTLNLKDCTFTTAEPYYKRVF